MCALCEKNKDDIEQDVTALNNTYEEALDFLDRDEQSVRCPALRAAPGHDPIALARWRAACGEGLHASIPWALLPPGRSWTGPTRPG